MIKSVKKEKFNEVRVMRKLNYQLDKGKKEPLYLQLYQQLRDLIYTQQLAFGEQLPSKRALCDYLQIKSKYRGSCLCAATRRRLY